MLHVLHITLFLCVIVYVSGFLWSVLSLIFLEDGFHHFVEGARQGGLDANTSSRRVAIALLGTVTILAFAALWPLFVARHLIWRDP